jgi:hypothetical protein
VVVVVVGQVTLLLWLLLPLSLRQTCEVQLPLLLLVLQPVWPPPLLLLLLCLSVCQVGVMLLLPLQAIVLLPLLPPMLLPPLLPVIVVPLLPPLSLCLFQANLLWPLPPQPLP